MCLRSAAREFEPVQAAVSTTGAPAQYTVGTPYVLPAVSVTASLPGDLGAAGRLTTTVTIAGANTTEGTRTVTATAAYDPATGLGPLVLPATTWTATGAGDVRFTLAAPGSAPPFGSAQFALTDDAKLDCSPAAIRVIDAAVPFGGAGRSRSIRTSTGPHSRARSTARSRRRSCSRGRRRFRRRSPHSGRARWSRRPPAGSPRRG